MKYVLSFISICIAFSSYERSYASAYFDGVPADSRNSVIHLLEKKYNLTDTASINKINGIAAVLLHSSPDSALYYAEAALYYAHKIKYTRGEANALLQSAYGGNLTGAHEKTLIASNKAIALYRKLGDKIGVANCYSELAKMYSLSGNYASSLKYLELSLKINESTNNEQGIADDYVSLGEHSFYKGQSSTSLDYYFKALALNIKLHNQPAIASIYNNIGSILYSIELFPKALEYFDYALKIWQHSKDQQKICIAYQNIGLTLLAQKRYEQALNYFKNALSIAIKQNNNYMLGGLYDDLGMCYANKNNLLMAFGYLNKSLQINTDNKFNYQKAAVMIDIATVYNDHKDYREALTYASGGYDLAVKLSNLNVKQDAALQFSKALAGLKKFKQAFKLQKQYLDIKDSLKTNESVQKLTYYVLESNFAAKQKQYDLLQQRKNYQYQQNIQKQLIVNIICVIIIIGMMLIFAVYYRTKLKLQKVNNLLEAKNKEVIDQKTDINAQANKLNDLNSLKDRLISILAHDLRSPLSTLRGLFTLLEDENINYEELREMLPQVLKKLDYTSEFLDTLLHWVNSQMEAHDNNVINFRIKELVNHEIENHLEQACAKNIELIEDMMDDIYVLADLNSIRIVIRNLITNAIKFTRQNDLIKVSACKHSEDQILITVSDTGIGMSHDTAEKLFKSKVSSGLGTNNEAGTGMGLLFCKDLITKCGGKIWVNSQPGVGTEFSILLPVGDPVQKQPTLQLA